MSKILKVYIHFSICSISHHLRDAVYGDSSPAYAHVYAFHDDYDLYAIATSPLPPQSSLNPP